MISSNNQQLTYKNAACRKSETDNKALPIQLPPMERQQKEIQYPGWHRGTTRKELGSEENDKIS